jgi:hypothetical protein
MSKRDIDAAVAAAHRPSPAAIEAMPLSAAEAELVADIVAQPQEAVADAPPARRPRIVRRSFGLVATGALAAAVFLVAIATGGGPGGSPPPAFAAKLVRLAKASPLVLLDAPGWHVADAGGSAAGGTMYFFHPRPAGGAGGTERPPPPSRPETAELRWRSGRLTSREVDRWGAALMTVNPTVPHGRLLAIHSRHRAGHLMRTAVWEDHGRVIYFRSAAPDLATFKYRLNSLRRVGTTAWLSALPPSVVRAARHGSG